MEGKITLDWCDGWLCVLVERASYSAPVMERVWWPVEKCGAYDARKIVGSKCERVANAHYVATVDGAADDVPDYRQTILLADGGNTRPVKAEDKPIPPPKVRNGVEVRWNAGRWQKRTARGWASA